MKKNVFIYGSHDTSDPRKGKEFPYLISKLFRGFSFRDCSFLKKSNVKAQLELFWRKKYLTIMFLLSKAHFVGQSMKTYILRSDILKNLEKNFAKLSF